jgi:X-X-X-Leu-X-X-Gly heptad repeat protein
MSTPNVTRDQLLKAQEIVQLGNIVEELRKIKWGGGDTSELENKISELNDKITALTSNNNQLAAALSSANALVAELQGQLSNSDPVGSDPTPDDINEVFSSVGITD